MSTFEELHRCLATDCGVDHWSDSLVEYGRELTRNLGEDGWHLVGASWRAQPIRWQCRCAQLLAAGDPAQAIPILLTMMDEEDDELVVTTADALRDFEPRLVAFRLTNAHRERLRAMASRGDVAAAAARAFLNAVNGVAL